jgi:NtrC-family two-component system response regulator AlgB
VATDARPRSLIESEQQQIALALHESSTLGEAAARLGIDPATLWRKRKRYGLERPRGHDRGRVSRSS